MGSSPVRQFVHAVFTCYVCDEFIVSRLASVFHLLDPRNWPLEIASCVVIQRGHKNSRSLKGE